MVCSRCPTPKTIKGLTKMGCIELCGGVHTAQRQTPIQIPTGFYISVFVSLLVSSNVNVPSHWKWSLSEYEIQWILMNVVKLGLRASFE